MQDIKSFRDLDVWQVGMDVAVECYALTGLLPAHERYGLTAQARKAAVSIPSNVAEGHNHHSTNAFRNHVSVALGSSAELETQIELACRLGYLKSADVSGVNEKLGRVGRMLRRLQQSLETQPRPSA